MARNQGSSIQEGNKVGHLKCQNGLERALERWETKLANYEVTPQTIWPIVKSLTKRDGSKAPSVIHCPLGPVFYPPDKANIIADCLENQFTAHYLCDCYHRHVEAKGKPLLATVDEDTPVKFQSCDISKEIKSLKVGKACGFEGIPNERLQHLPRSIRGLNLVAVKPVTVQLTDCSFRVIK
jgi:hypothetical protein